MTVGTASPILLIILVVLIVLLRRSRSRRVCDYRKLCISMVIVGFLMGVLMAFLGGDIFRPLFDCNRLANPCGALRARG